MTSALPKINFKKSFEKNLSGLAAYFVREAMKELAATPFNASHIHKARLQFKRFRALVRMARFGLEKEESRRLAHFFRDQGRALSSLRDLEVMLESIKPFIKAIPLGEEHTLLTRFRARLLDQQKKLHKKEKEAQARREVIHRLTRMQEEIPSWKPQEESPWVFLSGTRVCFNACRKRFRVLKKASNDQTLHNWRKEVKWLWYQMELLSDLWPVRFDAWINDLKTLSQGLGRHHDLVLLESAFLQFIQEEKEIDRLLIIKKIKKEKSDIEAKVYSLGNLFFSVKGSCFYRQLRACVKEFEKPT